ncbi:MAG: PepSY-associated TM helix domain-containing protein [Asticcacaulis sp.]|uniref:PepSY-associated TM helix domain-containing protein n=1 Tax=Asticcacaulis sp. TaxID=1872648 RepID=UPI0039E6BCCB
MQIKLLHRYVSLVFAALWAFQAVTGCLIVFRWDLDDATTRGPRASFEAQTFGAHLDTLVAQAGTEVSSVWAATGRGDRFDIYYSKGGVDRTLRVDGTGHAVRDRDNSGLSNGNIYDRLSDLHMALMLGDIGRTFIGISGLLLLTNLGLGLKLAWPRAGQWLKALRKPKTKAGVPFLYGWHRTLGLWLSVPALITVAAGVLLAFDDAIETGFKVDIAPPQGLPAQTSSHIAPSQALNAALSAYPGATLSGFSMAADDQPFYKIRLHAPGEMPRIWGMTTVFVSATDGRILSVYDARRLHSAPRLLLDVIYPLHTGQIGGFFGRIVQLLIGLWLLAMIGLGLTLWWKRRRLSR